MLVKDVIKQAAFLLDKEALLQYLDTPSEDVSTAFTDEEIADFEKTVNSLLRCFNIVENEVAIDYLPLTAEARMESEDGKLLFTAFARSMVSVLSVTDEYGNPVGYAVYPEYVKTQKGKVVVTYSYAPEMKALTSESDFSRIPERIFSYGVACEYCLIGGLYDEAVVWDKKYKDALLCAQSLSRPRVIRSRRWA